MFGPSFNPEAAKESQKTESFHIRTGQDEGFDIEKPTCLQIKKGDNKRYVPEVEEHDTFGRLYCREVPAKDLQATYDQWSVEYMVVMTDISSKFILTKQIIMTMFESLDQYDQESISCGLSVLFPDVETSKKYSQECSQLQKEVGLVIEVLQKDLDVCAKYENEFFSSEAEKKSRAAQAGCLPIPKLRDRIVHELDYILQRYQNHINVVLKPAHEAGEHAKGTSIWHWMKHKGHQAIGVVKKAMHKLLTFLQRNWENVLSAAVLTCCFLDYQPWPLPLQDFFPDLRSPPWVGLHKPPFVTY